VVDDVKRRAASLVSQSARLSAVGAPPVSTGETGAARAAARAALDRVADRVRTDLGDEPASSATAPDARPAAARAAVGDRVIVGLLGFEGVVKAVHGREAELDVRGKRIRAALDELRVVGAAAPARVSVQVKVQAREPSAADLNVIGLSVDEALSRADKFLDDALLGELRSVRLIHGHGTGQLRRALAQFLQVHPLVARFAAAPADQGGSGVTVVDLKD
jgi:DNA mismatch repair protein MutS2